MKKFAELFKRYRLRAEFETVTAFGNALAEKGFLYEDSIFYHWQKGTRVPSNRQVTLKVIEIFVEKNALKTISEANTLLSSADFGYLTEQEMKELHLERIFQSPFQVPQEIVHFTGREEIVEIIKNEIAHQKIFFLHGPPGVGKTALAIKLGHLLKSQFPDGVLWYKVDSSNVTDILLAIAYLFGEDISMIIDPEVRASIVRTLLAKKKVLLIFDNVTSQDNLSLLLPNTSSSCVIFSSQENILESATDYRLINLAAFTQKEVLNLFEIVINKSYVTKYKKVIITLGDKLGNLPLALHITAHIMATNINKADITFASYLSQLDEGVLDLQTLTYEDKNLFRAITIGFDTLDLQQKLVFISLGIFEGKDFSLEAVAFINKISIVNAQQVLKRLQKISFIEESLKGRYRTHPLMKVFARKHMKDSSYYLKAAFWYEQLLHEAEEKQSYRTLLYEADNIIYTFKKCYDVGYWDEVITLWNPIEKFLSDLNETKKLRYLAQTIDTVPSINIFQKMIIGYLILMLLSGFILFFYDIKMNFWAYLYGALWNLVPFLGGIN